MVDDPSSRIGGDGLIWRSHSSSTAAPEIDCRDMSRVLLGRSAEVAGSQVEELIMVAE